MPLTYTDAPLSVGFVSEAVLGQSAGELVC